MPRSICSPMSSSSLAADCLKWDWYCSGNFESTDCSRWFFMSPAHLHLMLKRVILQIRLLRKESIKGHLLANFCSCTESWVHSSAVLFMWKTYFSICQKHWLQVKNGVSQEASDCAWIHNHIKNTSALNWLIYRLYLCSTRTPQMSRKYKFDLDDWLLVSSYDYLLKTSAEIRSQDEHGPIQVHLVKGHCEWIYTICVKLVHHFLLERKSDKVDRKSVV